MSKGQNRKLNLLTLLGTLAFTLSTVPGIQMGLQAHALERGPASDDDDESQEIEKCVDRVRNGEGKGKDGVTCVFSKPAPKGLSGEVKAVVVVKETSIVKKSDEIKPKGEPEKPVEGFEISITGEHECSQCLTGTLQTSPKSVTQQYTHFSQISAYLAKGTKDRMDAAAKLAREKQIEAENEHKCNTRNGEPLKGAERLECRIDKMAELDESKAADYFHKLIKPELVAGIESNDPSKVAITRSLIGKLETSSTGDLLRDSVNDLKMYSQHTQVQKTQDMLLQKAMGLQANDPERARIIQQLRGIQSSKMAWDSYFRGRGFQVDNLASRTTDTLVQSMMATDTNYYTTNLEARYNDILNRYGILNNNGQNAQGLGTVGALGRTGRGSAAPNYYQGAPGMGQPQPRPGFQPGLPQQPQQPMMQGTQQPYRPGMNGMMPAGGRGKPMPGTRVQ